MSMWEREEEREREYIQRKVEKKKRKKKERKREGEERRGGKKTVELYLKVSFFYSFFNFLPFLFY